MAGHAEKFGISEIGSGENVFEHLQRPALMCNDFSNPVIAPQSHPLHRQGTDIYTDASHRVFLWWRLILTGGGFVVDGAT